MAKQSDFTKVAMKIAEHLKAKDRKAQKRRAIPFGMERVGLDAARARIQSMTREERREILQQIGLEKALALFKPYGRDDNAAS